MDTKKAHDYRNVNVVNKRRKVVLYKKLTPPRPELKKYNPLVNDSGLYSAISINNIAQATGNPAYGFSAWDLIQFNNPTQGTSSKDRIGQRFSLKYLRLKGYVEVNYKVACKINYKLLLIRSDLDLESNHKFLNSFFSNYQYPSGWTDTSHSFSDDAQRAAFGRHNYYKMIRNVDNWPLGRIVIRVLNDGTITNFPTDTPNSTWTVGSSPAVSTTVDDGPAYKAYYPINLNVTVNDDIKVGKERYYYMLITDQPIGYQWNSGVKGVSRSHAYVDRAFELSFFTTAYYTDS